MAGLLGMMVAGGVKGYADQRIKENEAQQAFDMKSKLLEAEYEMRSKLEAAGIKAKTDAIEADRTKVKGILDSVKDPNADKGGYETPEMKAKSEKEMLIRQRKALTDAGRFDEAKSIDDQLTRMDTSEAKSALLDWKEKQLTQQGEMKSRELDLREKANEATHSARLAQIEAANARSEATRDKKTETDKLYEAYAERVRKEGAPDGKGRISHTPFSRDKWNEMQLDKAAARKAKEDTTRVETEYGADGEVVGRKEVSSGKSKASSQKQVSVRKYIPGKGLQ